MNRVAFLDRDGTIIRDVAYLNDPSQVSLLPGAAEALRLLLENGFKLMVVSNQSGVARGLITKDELLAVHKRCHELLLNEGVFIAEYRFCLHHPDDHCKCRKPGTEMVDKSPIGANAEMWCSVVFGDRECDMQLADALGCEGWQVSETQNLLTCVKAYLGIP